MKDSRTYKDKHNENFATEQDISNGATFSNDISSEEELYRKKEEYDAKFTLYKGSIQARDNRV